MTQASTQHDGLSRLVSVPVARAKGRGGSLPDRALYEAHIDGKPYVLWELEDGRVACASAVCPHKPMLGPVLNIRGMVEGESLRCMVHANLYSGTTGACIQVMGHRDPGTMAVFYGRRDRNSFVIDMPQSL